MAWCRKATSHYLSQCWPSSMSPYGVTRLQWVKVMVCYRTDANNCLKTLLWIRHPAGTNQMKTWNKLQKFDSERVPLKCSSAQCWSLRSNFNMLVSICWKLMLGHRCVLWWPSNVSHSIMIRTRHIGQLHSVSLPVAYFYDKIERNWISN